MLKKFLLLCFFVIGLAFSITANAAINFRIDSKNIPKIKILMSASGSNAMQVGSPTNYTTISSKSDIEEILTRVRRNLNTTDLFDILQKDSISSVSAGNVGSAIEKVPDFVKYRAAGVEMLLVADTKFNPSGDLEIKIRLWDVMDEKQLFGKFYSSNRANYKKMANLISDEIFKAGANEKMGHFDSKITYIAESGNILKRVKRVALMDFDGENLRYLTNGRDLVLTPIFSGQKNEILFVRFFGSGPQIYSIDTNNALVRKVGSFRGTTFAPTTSLKNPNLLAFSVIENGNSNIYQMNLFTNQTIKLTNTRAIDTTPSYSPDGSKIVFSSDRSGSQQLYVMNSDGSNVRKISVEGGSYSKPMWSPDGRFIAFTKLKSNQFSIGILDVDGKNEKILTSGYLVEGAKWSPSSRYIIYSRKNGAFGRDSIPRLWIIDIVSGIERELPTPLSEGATDPDWAMN